MKYKIKSILIILISCLFFQTKAQVSNHLITIITEYPSDFSSTNDLVRLINKDFKNKEEKAAAAFTWIALNIAYDTKQVGKPNRVRFSYRTEEELLAKKKQYRIDLAEKSLKKKKALCESYSTLYQILCNKMNIECKIVPGTARRYVSEIGKSNLPSNHAWNAIKIHNKWLLVDVTWAAGWVDYSKMKFHKEFSPAYFASSPEEFAMKHYPDNEEWLLKQTIQNKTDFALQPIPFKAFFGKGIKLISPKKGIQNIKKGNALEFKLLNVTKETEIAYHFKSDKFGKKVKSIRKNNSLLFKIYREFKGKNELIIYFDNIPALGYKVNSK
ncbi:transglutaminase domain-containing protein [Marinifilum sp. RC60d5]|uniref:transglutaminase domain-containing protein n=1 Tax=Marinifilum sp. RC60d5 TaxID=3458414 RepID=UPI004035DCFE